MNNLLRVEDVGDGILVKFFDQSNRYYGDFYRVKISIVATIPFDPDSLPDDLRKVATMSDSFICYEKNLEQMGVPTANVTIVTNALIDNFLESVSHYFKKETFVAGLLRQQMNRNVQTRLIY